MIHEFEKPFVFEGKTYEQIEFDLEGLKGSDISEAKKRFVKAGNYAVLPAMDSDFCAILLARLCRLPDEFFDQLPAREYCALTQKVSNFLMA